MPESRVQPSCCIRATHLLNAAIIAWVIFASSMIVKTVVAPKTHTVYPTYAESGRTWWLGGDRSAGKWADYLDRQYAPLFFVLMGPFCCWDDRIGVMAWSIVSWSVYISGLWVFARHVIEPRLCGNRFGAFLVLSPWVGVASLLNGQANVPMAGAMMWTCYWVVRERWSLVALLLAGVVWIKTYPIAFALVLVGLYPRHLLGRFVLAIIALGLLPFLCRSPDYCLERYARYGAYLVSGEHYTQNLVVLDVREALSYWTVPIAPKNFIAVQVLTGAIVFAVMRRFQANGDRRQTATFAYVLTMFWMLSFGPATEEATFLLGGPAVAWAVLHLPPASLGHAGRLLFFILFVAVGPMQTSVFGESVRRFTLEAKLAPVALFMLMVAAMIHALRETGARFTVSTTMKLPEPATVS